MNSTDDHIDPIDFSLPHHGVTYPKPFDQMADALCASASRSIRIFSAHLDQRVFDNTNVTDALSALARRNSHSFVRLLINDSRPIVQQGHRLLTLARRLPSSVEIRRLSEHPEWSGETVVLRDLSGMLLMTEDDGPGFYDPDSRAAAQPWIDKFDRLWPHGIQDPEFRSLGL